MRKIASIIFYVGIALFIIITLFKTLILSNSPGIFQSLSNQLEIALWTIKNSKYAQILILFIIAYPFFYLLFRGKGLQRFMAGLLLITAICATLLLSKVFGSNPNIAKLNEKEMTFLTLGASKVKLDNYVVGINFGNRQKAYPLEVLAYHNIITDKFGYKPVVISYDKSNLAARAFEGTLKNKPLDFEVIGYINGNSVYKDIKSNSYFQQGNGAGIYGPYLDQKLTEINTTVTTLRKWSQQHPSTSVLQKNKDFADKYTDLNLLENINDDYLKTTSKIKAWSDNALVVGVKVGSNHKAYDLRNLMEKRLINDMFNAVPVLIFIEADNKTIHVLERKFNGRVANFRYDDAKKLIVDTTTQSKWKPNGICIEGSQRGKRLNHLNYTVEKWGSWNKFRPNTSQYE